MHCEALVFFIVLYNTNLIAHNHHTNNNHTLNLCLYDQHRYEHQRSLGSADALSPLEDVMDADAIGILTSYVTTALQALQVEAASFRATLSEFRDLQVCLCLSLSLRLKGLFLLTVGILFHVEWCIRQLLSTSRILYNTTSIAYNHHTYIYHLLNT